LAWRGRRFWVEAGTLDGQTLTWVAIGIFEALRLALRGLLLVLAIHFLRAAALALRKTALRAPSFADEWPCVTVQLPIRNEYYVVERVIRAACALEYPLDKIEIQVLDDSTDETREVARNLVEELRRDGHDIQHIVRDNPTGFKAGALNSGLVLARGELVALFDADCVPPPDFLRKVLPYFGTAAVGCVQVRWSFLNRTHSLLTRLQAIVLDGLFVVDQFARANADLPLQFNGTNGVWRRSAIDRAGGWDPSILAEDADLSFRAYLVGYRVVHVTDYAVPTEIPEDMAAFRAQQRRWALGSAQMLRALGWRILRAPIPLRAKLMMYMHLGRHAIDPLILLACFTSPFTTLYGMPFLIDYGSALNAGLLALVTFASVIFYATALHKGGAHLREAALAPLIIPLAIGLSVVYTVAFFQGIFGVQRPFVRTPKAGDRRTAAPRYRPPADALCFAELGLAIAHAYFAWQAYRHGIPMYALFFAGLFVSFGWVGLGTLVSGVFAHSDRPMR
jgi:cellulose synthase/poly-beta-1,6-N-acetylglucosamine synthase-like glycosyltransferase